jgi:SpoVK/Ycf46/Vps4 family AAA+-type ATPase
VRTIRRDAVAAFYQTNMFQTLSEDDIPNPHVIPARFQHELDQHLVFNFVGTGSWPLVLGVFGRPGDGKSFQVRTHLERRGVLVVSINAADLESDRAGQPGKLVLARYEDAGHRTSEGMPAALIVDDFDTTVGEWEHSTSTVNHQQVLAQLMHLADSPTQAANTALHRVPVFITGNDLSKIYPPLRRPGRMRPFFWLPTEAERQEVVEQIMVPILDQAGTAELLAQLPEAPIAFFSNLLVSTHAIAAQAEIPKYAKNLKALVKSAERSRQDLDNHVRQHKPPLNEVLQSALALWHEQTIATRSHLNE